MPPQLIFSGETDTLYRLTNPVAELIKLPLRSLTLEGTLHSTIVFSSQSGVLTCLPSYFLAIVDGVLAPERCHTLKIRGQPLPHPNNPAGNKYNRMTHPLKDQAPPLSVTSADVSPGQVKSLQLQTTPLTAAQGGRSKKAPPAFSVAELGQRENIQETS